MRYREGEYPGEFTVKTRDGQRTIAAVLRGRRRVQTSQDAPLSGLRRLVVRSRRRLHFRRRSQHLCQQPERSEAASAIHRDDANGSRAKRSCRLRFNSASQRSRREPSFPRRISAFSASGFVTPPLPRPCPTGFRRRRSTTRKPRRCCRTRKSSIACRTICGSARAARAAGAGRRQGTPVTIGFDVTSAREIVWRPPGDKAIAQRAAFAAALSDGTSTLRNVPQSDDIEGNLGILRQLGVDIWEAADTSYRDRRPGLAGPQAVREARSTLSPGNSATTARILMGLLAGTPGRISHRRQRTPAPASDGVDRRAAAQGGSRYRLRSRAGRLAGASFADRSLAPSTIRSTSSARNRCRRCSLPDCKAAVKR